MLTIVYHKISEMGDNFMSSQDWFILALTFLGLWAGHWFPWHVWPPLVDQDKRLKPVLCYVYGLAFILGGLWIWCLVHRAHHEAALFATLLTVAAGAGTVAPRVLRLEMERQALKKDQADYEQAIKS